jgi:uncharacterized protein YcbX
MQARVRAIHVSPVKSLRLSTLDEAMLTGRGIPGDRAFVLVRPDDERAPFLTMRRAGRLARAVAVYDPISGRLSITIDGQQPLTGEPGRRPAHSLQMWGRDVTGYLVDGPWAAALSELVGRDVELMEVDDRSHGQDAYPVSLLSIESCTELGDRNGGGAPDPRRFRPSILIEGAEPHAEDGWIGEHLRVGEAVVRVAEKDTRCVLTTLNPDTGERDLDTLRMIAAYRPPEDSEVCFGVYADVVQEGRVRVGDPIAPAGDR